MTGNETPDRSEADLLAPRSYAMGGKISTMERTGADDDPVNGVPGGCVIIQ